MPRLMIKINFGMFNVVGLMENELFLRLGKKVQLFCFFFRNFVTVVVFLFCIKYLELII